MLSRSEKERIEKSLLTDDPFQQTLSDYKDANTRRTDNDTEDTAKSSIQDLNSGLLTKASMELPLRWENGRIEKEKNVKTTITCCIPPTANNGRWSATVHGSSIARGPMGCASGSMNVAYQLTTSSQIHGGMQVGDQANVCLGGTIRRNRSSVGLNVVSKPNSPPTTIFSAQRKVDQCLFHSRVTLGSSLVNWYASVSLLTTSKVQLGMGWNRSQPLIHLEIGPKISAHRNGMISIRWRPTGGWHIGLSLIQALASKVTSLGIGVRLSKKKLEWVFSWNRGDVTVRIPIILTQQTDVWITCLHAIFLSMVSTAIQDAIADLYNLNASKEEHEKLRKEHYRMKRDKARKDAEQQKKLMLLQAQSRAKAEQAKRGLVIRQATYQVTGGDSWDVTAQLQFWIENSRLELPSCSKQNLLGFYNVATGSMNDEDEGTWWPKFWKQSKSQTKSQTPTLTVQYYFSNRLYEITILDNEPLILPSSKAIPQ
jgi:hypothetical protein